MLRQIAAGAFGSVHCVQRHDTKVIHAAKYVKSKTADLEREVSALRELSGKSREEILRNAVTAQAPQINTINLELFLGFRQLSSVGAGVNRQCTEDCS